MKTDTWEKCYPSQWKGMIYGFEYSIFMWQEWHNPMRFSLLDASIFVANKRAGFIW